MEKKVLLIFGVIVCLLIGAILVTSGPSQPPATPSSVPAVSRIAFTSDRDSPAWEIYVMNADGSEVTRVTDNEIDDWAPAWSPDGQRIAFVSEPDDAPPGASQRGQQQYLPGSSPGTLGNWEICTTLAPHTSVGVDAGASGVENLTNNPAHDLDPAWSPDGTRIAFASNREDDNYEIYMMDVAGAPRSEGIDGRKVTRLTNDPAWDLQPTWSPDGTYIAFVSNREGYDNYQVYVLNVADALQKPDSRNVTRLTNRWSIDPVWSPAGTHVACALADQSSIDICMINVDGGGVARLANGPVCSWHPSWSPDGQYIAFVSGCDFKSFKICVLNVKDVPRRIDSGEGVSLTNGLIRGWFPAWAPK